MQSPEAFDHGWARMAGAFCTAEIGRAEEEDKEQDKDEESQAHGLAMAMTPPRLLVEALR